jgi:hypothetical protein
MITLNKPRAPQVAQVALYASEVQGGWNGELLALFDKMTGNHLLPHRVYTDAVLGDANHVGLRSDTVTVDIHQADVQCFGSGSRRRCFDRPIESNYDSLSQLNNGGIDHFQSQLTADGYSDSESIWDATRNVGINLGSNTAPNGMSFGFADSLFGRLSISITQNLVDGVVQTTEAVSATLFDDPATMQAWNDVYLPELTGLMDQLAPNASQYLASPGGGGSMAFRMTEQVATGVDDVPDTLRITVSTGLTR